jgi:hypothetical protein
MIIKRLMAASAVLSLAMMLSACGGYVADRWPHWAGGLPPDAPPRPGAPGYDDFIAHGEPAAPNAPAPAAGANAGPATGGVTSTVAQPNAVASAPQTKTPAKGRNGNVQMGRLQTAPASAKAEPEAAASAEPVETPTADDPSVVKGGLY